MEATRRTEEMIASFTAEDYQTARPYEWLYGFRKDSFTMERLRGQMLADAKAKKVTNAGILWREFLKGKMGGGSQKSVVQNVTAFTGQPLELLCGDYECYDDGIRIATAYGGTTTVCSHPIMPVKRLVNIESGDVKMEIAFRRGGRWRRETYEKSLLSAAKSIVGLSTNGVSVTSESAKDLVKYLAFVEDANYDTLPEAQTIGRLGWVDGYGFSPYVDGLMYDAAGMYGDAFSSVKQHGSYEKWLEVAKAVRSGASVPCRIILAASFASPLVALTGALPFILHLWGSVSGIGKSVALILAASVWAYPEIGSYVKTTKSTNVGYEQMAAFCGHLPLCMDELQMIQGKKEFDELIYSLCEGVSKTRGAKAGGVQQVQRWRNAILTTGEMPITTSNSKAGALNRVIEVECTDKLFPDPRTAYQALVANYGHAGRKFVEALTDNEAAKTTLLEMQQTFYEELQGKATDKQVLTASLILAADAMADLLLFDDGQCLTAEDIVPYLVSQSEANTNGRAYEWLCDWIAANTRRLCPDDDYATGECYGSIGDGECYIIKSIFDRVMTEVGFNPASFLSWAFKAGLIQRSGKHLTKMKRLKGLKTPARCVCLKLPDEEAEEVFDQMEMVATEQGHF